MNHPELFKVLRIAFSATCVLVAVLLCVLWVRSYWRVVLIAQTTPSSFRVTAIAASGRMVLRYEHAHKAASSLKPASSSWYRTFPLQNVANIESFGSGLGFEMNSQTNASPPGSTYYRFKFPFWFAALLVTALATAPWVHWSKRFSLRTLLIATTLVAVMLGMAVYLLR